MRVYDTALKNKYEQHRFNGHDNRMTWGLKGGGCVGGGGGGGGGVRQGMMGYGPPPKDAEKLGLLGRGEVWVGQKVATGNKLKRGSFPLSNPVIHHKVTESCYEVITTLVGREWFKLYIDTLTLLIFSPVILFFWGKPSNRTVLMR